MYKRQERYPDNLRFADVSRSGQQSMMDLQLFAEGEAAPALSPEQTRQAVAAGTLKPEAPAAQPEVPQQTPAEPEPQPETPAQPDTIPETVPQCEAVEEQPAPETEALLCAPEQALPPEPAQSAWQPETRLEQMAAELMGWFDAMMPQE